MNRIAHIVFLLCCFAPPGMHAAAADSKPPHIIFILADDLGLGDLGCYGGTLAPTPNIDRLAEEGIRFAQYYSASPICSPSRAGLITGMFPARWQITSFLQTRAGNRGVEQADFLDPQAPSLPRLLKSEGYATAHFGKWHLGGGRDVTMAPTFDVYGYNEYAGTYESPQPHADITATDWIWSGKDKVKRWDRTGFFVDRTIDFFERHQQQQPCFVNLWLDDPHTPWVPGPNAAKGDTQENLRGVLAEMDKQVGRLMEGLEKMGVANDTLVIFTSDNGPLPTFKRNRTANLRGSKLSLYEGGIRVPWIARWHAKVPAKCVDDETVLSAVDMLPTLCSLARVKLDMDAKLDGQDMSAALLGTPIQRGAPLLWEYGRNEEFFKFPKQRGDRSPNLAIRDGTWKLLVNADGSNRELYDLTRDAQEQKNVANVHPDVADRLGTKVISWRNSLPAAPQLHERP